MTGTTPVSPSLWQRIEAYLKEKEIDLETCSNQSGVNITVLHNLAKGGRCQARNKERIEAFLEGRKLEDEPLRETMLDTASARMLDEILRIATGNGRVLPVVSGAIKKLEHSKPDEVETVAWKVVEAYLSTVPENERIGHLFQLYRLAEKD